MGEHILHQVQLEILLDTSGNWWLRYCQIPDLWCLDTRVPMLISAVWPRTWDLPAFNQAASQAGGLGTALGSTCFQQSSREERGGWCRFGEADKPVGGKEGMAWPAWPKSMWQQGTGIIPMLGERNESEQKGKADSSKINGKASSGCTSFHKNFTAFHKDFSSTTYTDSY